MKIRMFLLTLLGIWLAAGSSAFAEEQIVEVRSPVDAKILRIAISPGDLVYSGDEIATLKKDDGAKIILRAGISGKVLKVGIISHEKVKKDDEKEYK